MSDLQAYIIGKDTGEKHLLIGRITTVGSAPACHIQIPGAPAQAAHFIFGGGAYQVQAFGAAKVLRNGNPVTGSERISHGDELVIGKKTFIFHEHDSEHAGAGPGRVHALGDLVTVIVSLLRNSGTDVFCDLVASVARLLASDASRLVVEDDAGERRTIAHFPSQHGLDRFSNRAIDWAHDHTGTVIQHDFDWQDATGETNSLTRNSVASVLCGALRSGDLVLGYLYLDRLRNSPPFTDEDRVFCDSLLPLFSEILCNYHQRRRQQETIARLQETLLDASSGIIYAGKTMADALSLAQRAARTESPVLIQGETGTGKELFARFIHDKSSRVQKPFKALNCGAIPENLMESLLFGHEKGAFTGAVQQAQGLFDAAEGGTLFLDEIGELPLSLQVKLLRALQESEIIRVGGTQSIKVNVRIIAATNRQLDKEVTAGRFRQDLFYRLDVLTVRLPPLRERDNDTLLLAEYFTKKYCAQFGLPAKTLSASSRAALLSHQWPGNVRELENAIQKAIIRSVADRLVKEDFDFSASPSFTAGQTAAPVTLKDTRAKAEHDIICQTLAKTQGNVSMASKLLEIDRKWLMKKMDELGIDGDTYRA